MNQSPLFIKTHELLLWLIPQTAKFPREQRFAITQSVQQSAMRFLDRLIEAGMYRGAERVARLSQADVELVKLKAYLRLCEGMNLLTPRQVEHVAHLTLPVGKLLGAWLAQEKKSGITVPANHPAVGID